VSPKKFRDLTRAPRRKKYNKRISPQEDSKNSEKTGDRRNPATVGDFFHEQERTSRKKREKKYDHLKKKNKKKKTRQEKRGGDPLCWEGTGGWGGQSLNTRSCERGVAQKRRKETIVYSGREKDFLKKLLTPR